MVLKCCCLIFALLVMCGVILTCYKVLHVETCLEVIVDGCKISKH